MADGCSTLMVVNGDEFDRGMSGSDIGRTRVARGTCLPPALLRAEAEGVLPDDVAARVRAHVSSCVWCRRLRESLLSADIEAMTAEEEQRVRLRIDLARRRTTRRRRLRTWTPVLAAAVLLVAMRLPRPAAPPLPPNPHIAASVPYMRVVPAAAETLVATPAAIELPASSVLSRGRATFAQRFAAALAPYGAGAYADAARRLAPLTVEAPSDAPAQFYLGVSRLLAGDAKAAIAPLQAARRLAADRFGTESTWYLALAHVQAANGDAAQAELTRLCGLPVPHGVDACAALDALSSRR